MVCPNFDVGTRTTDCQIQVHIQDLSEFQMTWNGLILIAKYHLQSWSNLPASMDELVWSQQEKGPV